MSRTTTNGDIYKLMTDLRLELKGDIGAVAKQVSELSETVGNNELKQTVSSTKLGMLITGITVVASAIVTIIVSVIIGKPVR